MVMQTSRSLFRRYFVGRHCSGLASCQHVIKNQQDLIILQTSLYVVARACPSVVCRLRRQTTDGRATTYSEREREFARTEVISAA